VQEAKINPRVMDDMGRTALHDCCWSTQPNLDTMDILLQVMPPVSLLMQDTRGNTPFDYAPRKHWGIWLKYLQEREHVFVNWIVSRRRLVAARAAAAQMEAQAKRRVEREQDYMVQLQQRIASSSSSSSSSLSVPSSSVSSLLGRTIRLDWIYHEYAGELIGSIWGFVTVGSTLPPAAWFGGSGSFWNYIYDCLYL